MPIEDSFPLHGRLGIANQAHTWILHGLPLRPCETTLAPTEDFFPLHGRLGIAKQAHTWTLHELSVRPSAATQAQAWHLFQLLFHFHNRGRGCSKRQHPLHPRLSCTILLLTCSLFQYPVLWHR